MRDKIQAKYEAKLSELRTEIEKEARNLMAVQEQRDTALQAKSTADSQKVVILDQIVSAKEKLIEVQSSLEKQKKISQGVISELQKNADSLEKNIKGFRFEKKGLIKTISEMTIKVGKLKPITKEYDDMVVNLKNVTKKEETAKVLLDDTNREAGRVISEARGIKQAALKLKSDNEDWFRRLQSFETGLNFYAERLRRWYQGKNLRLPVSYKPENIREKITQNG